MIKSRMNLHNKLFGVAELQYGYFTTRQAIECGFTKESLSYHVKTGRWIHSYHGIYRLRGFPLYPEYDQYMKLYLWSATRDGRAGVFSHQTALSLYELSDIMPAKIHMTVPVHYRRFCSIPEVLVLHQGELQSEDVTEMAGFKVTTVLRTLIDMVKAQSISIDILVQGAQQAYQRGLVSKKKFQTDPGLSFFLPFINL